jgi:hypothetical protein
MPALNLARSRTELTEHSRRGAATRDREATMVAIVGILEKYRDNQRRGKRLALRMANEAGIVLPPDFLESFYKQGECPDIALAALAM